MKKSLMLCGLLLAVTASMASAAAGTNLRWSACFGDGGAANRNSTCLSNLGNAGLLVGSFELGTDQASASGIEVVIDIATAGPSLPPWWDLYNLGSCRANSLSANPTISGTAANCFDWSAGFAAGGIAAYNVGIAGPNTARVIVGYAVAASHLQGLISAAEYFGVNLVINNANTTGTGACAGCSVPACIVFNSVKIATPNALVFQKLSGPTNGTDSNYCTWQGGAGVNSNRGSGCPAATPTHKSTWNSVKSLYR